MVYLLVSADTAFAQSGSLTKTVTHAETGETLPGSNVLIVELSRSASTDADGFYRIANIPSGTPTLTASFVGYEDYIQKIEIQDNEQLLRVNYTVEYPLTRQGDVEKLITRQCD